MILRTCRTCHEDKPVDEFGVDKYKPDGKSTKCKRCTRIASRTDHSKIKQYMDGAAERGKKWRLGSKTALRIIACPCVYCGRHNPEPDAYGKPMTGIDRRKNDQGYFKANAISCCTLCNHTKSDVSVRDFITMQTESHYNLLDKRTPAIRTRIAREIEEKIQRVNNWTLEAAEARK